MHKARDMSAKCKITSRPKSASQMPGHVQVGYFRASVYCNFCALKTIPKTIPTQCHFVINVKSVCKLTPKFNHEQNLCKLRKKNSKCCICIFCSSVKLNEISKFWALNCTKMHLVAGLRPDPLGSYSAPPDPLAVMGE